MLLTHEIIHSAGTNGNGFNKSQLELLGVQWPPKKGWLSGLIGTHIPDERWHQVMALSGVKQKLKRKEILAGQNILI